MIKQVIVVRTDLNMRKGKLAAQVAHASLKIFLDRIYNSFLEKVEHDFSETYNQLCNTNFTKHMLEWINWKEGQQGFTKIVVGCKDENELYIIQEKAKEANIPYALIKDNGVTEFHGVQTTTCICLGPDESDKIDLITGEYKLL